MDRQYWYGQEITRLNSNHIFVFGSNPKGRHGAGAAKYARDRFGAKYGQGRGIQGQSYGLVTKNLDENYFEKSTGITYQKTGYRSVSPEQIKSNINELYKFASENPDKRFLISYRYDTYPNGNPKKSLNGYNSEEFLNLLFNQGNIPDNIVFHESHKEKIELKFKELKSLNQKSQNVSEIYKTYNNQQHLGLVRKVNQQTNQSFVPFYKVNNVFSQFHPSPFTYKGIQFISCEQFMMYSKAKLFNDEDVANQIIKYSESDLAKKVIELGDNLIDIVFDNDFCSKWESIQREIKKLGRQVKGYNDKDWFKIRESVIFVGNREKYNQNKILQYFLISTEDAILVEASVKDKTYGAGVSKNSPLITQQSKWSGLNLLGNCLMKVRSSLTLKNKPLEQNCNHDFSYKPK